MTNLEHNISHATAATQVNHSETPVPEPITAEETHLCDAIAGIADNYEWLNVFYNSYEGED